MAPHPFFEILSSFLMIFSFVSPLVTRMVQLKVKKKTLASPHPHPTRDKCNKMQVHTPNLQYVLSV